MRTNGSAGPIKKAETPIKEENDRFAIIKQESTPREKFRSYVGIRSDTLPKFCRLLTNCYTQDRLSISLSLPSVEVHAWEGCRENLLDCFEECRGVGNAAIHEPHSPPSHGQTGSSKTSSSIVAPTAIQSIV